MNGAQGDLGSVCGRTRPQGRAYYPPSPESPVERGYHKAARSTITPEEQLLLFKTRRRAHCFASRMPGSAFMISAALASVSSPARKAKLLTTFFLTKRSTVTSASLASL